MSILITGMAGFIGGHAAEYMISQGKDVVGCDSLTYASRQDLFKKIGRSIPTYGVDICDTDLIKKIVSSHNVDTIINFAAETHVDNSIKNVNPFLHSNIMGVASLLEVVKDAQIRMVHVSTDEVYGPAIGEKSFHEDDKLSPKNPYSASKASADLLIDSFKNTYGVNVGIVRPCNNFGPRQHSEKFIPTILRSLRSGNPVPVYGNGLQMREWMFVKDTARIICDLSDKCQYFDILNISSQNEVKNIDLIEKICQIMKFDFKSSIRFIQDRPGHDIRYSIRNDKIKEIMNLDFTSFSEALEETILEMK